MWVPCAAVPLGCGGQAGQGTVNENPADAGGSSSGAASGAASGLSRSTTGAPSGSSGTTTGISTGTGASSGSSGSVTGVSTGSSGSATGVPSGSSGSTTGVSTGSSGTLAGPSDASTGSSSGCDLFPIQCACQPWSFVAFDAGGVPTGADAAPGFIPGRQFCYLTCPGTNCEPGTPDQGVWCHADCTGRRPAGLLASDSASGTPLQVHFAEMARLEAASVAAFRHMRRELVAHRAPKRLVRAAERAARDEIRHARMTGALARRHGAVPAAPEVGPCAVRSLLEIAIENAIEGCVREAFGALVACWQAQAASDPVIRAAMKRIARDETRHAALAFGVDAWARGRLSASERERVDVARREALSALLSRSNDVPPSLRGPLGLPGARETRVLAQEMARLAA
jgi:hypothetical protein